MTKIISKKHSICQFLYNFNIYYINWFGFKKLVKKHQNEIINVISEYGCYKKNETNYCILCKKLY